MSVLKDCKWCGCEAYAGDYCSEWCKHADEGFPYDEDTLIDYLESIDDEETD